MLLTYFGIYALAFLKYLTKLYNRMIIAVEIQCRINAGYITDKVFVCNIFRCTWVKNFDPLTLPKKNYEKQRQAG